MKIIRITVMIIMLTLLILPAVLNFEAEAASSDDYVKVGLKYGSTAVNSCTLASEDGFMLGTAENRSFEEGMPLPGYTKLVIANESGAVVIRDENGTLLSADLGSDGCIMPYHYNTDDDATLSFDTIPYRDGIMFRINSGGTLTVINYITLEHYIYGVLNSELNYTNPTEALKAQAVAARSFGELNLGKHSSDGFDFCTTTHCQVYKGYSGEYASIIEAVDATKGELLRYDGEPVTAYYFKNSGGYTQNAEDVWSGSVPYLKSVKDEYCPSYPWSTSLSFGIIQTKLESSGYQPGNIVSVSITEKNDTGSVSELKITGTDATVYLRKEKIRNVLGATVIKSNMFCLADSTSSEGTAGWNISNGSSTIKFDTEVYALNGSGTVDLLRDDDVYSCSGTSTVELGSTSSSVETVTGGTAVFNGYGYGHGVGMPQDSAVEMAKQGFTYDEILKYYFTGIEVD